jgi:hypothetical protein
MAEMSVSLHNSNPTEAGTTFMHNQFEAVFASIDKTLDGMFSKNHIGTFLDLGCAPGGFSKFILENTPSSRGLGVTLPGIPISLQGTALTANGRYRVHDGDITRLNFDIKSTARRLLA